MKFPTHNKGNTLDLILTGTVSNFNIISVNQWHFLSDHCSVIIFLDYPKPGRWTESVSYRKWKDIDVNDFIADIDIDELKSLDCSLKDLLDRMENYVQKAFDKHIPLKHLTSGIWSNKLWYKYLQEERKLVRKNKHR